VLLSVCSLVRGDRGSRNRPPVEALVEQLDAPFVRRVRIDLARFDGHAPSSLKRKEPARDLLTRRDPDARQRLVVPPDRPLGDPRDAQHGDDGDGQPYGADHWTPVASRMPVASVSEVEVRYTASSSALEASTVGPYPSTSATSNRLPGNVAARRPARPRR
jgi:hypothetical protein